MLDEIVCAVADGRKLPFNLTEAEWDMINAIFRDNYFKRNFGSKEITDFTSSDIRKYLTDQF